MRQFFLWVWPSVTLGVSRAQGEPFAKPLVAPSRVCYGGASQEARECPEILQGTKTKLTPGGKTGVSPPS
jgi:hypothetical protein